jgi:hypothetical protein
MTCNTTEHKRCYIDYLSDKSDPVLECQCLKGLYKTNNTGKFECLGVLRFDFTFYIYVLPVFINQQKLTSQIKKIIQTMPSNVVSNLITDTSIGMDLESSHYASSADGNSVVAYNKLVVWKKNAINPNDLPTLSLNDMTQYVMDYFKGKLSFNTSSNYTMLDTVLIGEGILTEFKNLFILFQN